MIVQQYFTFGNLARRQVSTQTRTMTRNQTKTLAQAIRVSIAYIFLKGAVLVATPSVPKSFHPSINTRVSYLEPNTLVYLVHTVGTNYYS